MGAILFVLGVMTGADASEATKVGDHRRAPSNLKGIVDRIHVLTQAIPDRPPMLRVTLTYWFKEKEKPKDKYYVVATMQRLRARNPELIFDQPPVTLTLSKISGAPATCTLVLKDGTRAVQFHLFASLVERKNCKIGKRCLPCAKWGKHFSRGIDSTSRAHLRDGMDFIIYKGMRDR